MNNKNKTTHTIQDIEQLMHDFVIKIQNAETKTEKQALLKKLKGLEAHYNSCNDKNINGKKYPVKKKPEPITKKELLALIDDIDHIPRNGETSYIELDREGIDLSGVFISKE